MDPFPLVREGERRLVFLYEWQKSSYSAGQSACVEVAHAPTAFRKSSYSANAQACVEVAADTQSGAAMRDTKHRELSALMFDRAEWHAFIRGTKDSHQ